MGNCLWRQAGPRSTVKCSLMRITVARLSFRYALGCRVTDPIRYTPVPILRTVLPTLLTRTRSWIWEFPAAKHGREHRHPFSNFRYSPSTRLIDCCIAICGIEITFRRVATFTEEGGERDRRGIREMYGSTFGPTLVGALCRSDSKLEAVKF